MKINGTNTTVFVLAGLLVVSLSTRVFPSQQSLSRDLAFATQEDKASDESGDEEDDDGDGAEETDVRPYQAGITAEEAQAAAEAHNPGTKAIEVELENENGTLVYEVELDNGLEVIVDANSGKILGTERDDED